MKAPAASARSPPRAVADAVLPMPDGAAVRGTPGVAPAQPRGHPWAKAQTLGSPEGSRGRVATGLGVGGFVGECGRTEEDEEAALGFTFSTARAGSALRACPGAQSEGLLRAHGVLPQFIPLAQISAPCANRIFFSPVKIVTNTTRMTREFFSLLAEIIML